MSYGERRLQLDWFHWQDKRNPDSPCPSCPGGKKCSRFGKSLGEKKKGGREEEVEIPPGWYVLPSPGSSPPYQSQPQEHLYLLLCNRSSAAFCLFKLPLCFPRMMVSAVPRAYSGPKGGSGWAGSAGLNALIWPEPAQPV